MLILASKTAKPLSKTCYQILPQGECFFVVPDGQERESRSGKDRQAFSVQATRLPAC